MQLNILVVDDSKVTRKMIGRTLAMAGIPVGTLMEAENGAEGLKKMNALLLMERAPFDVVIADINMPEMNGVEMIEHMIKDPKLKGIPVIVVSTEGSQTRIEELRGLGVQAYIRKPFTPEDVRDMIRQIVGDWDDESNERSA
jgi:two-component system, chemotaxis family, chemotaxis protein CheY